MKCIKDQRKFTNEHKVKSKSDSTQVHQVNQMQLQKIKLQVSCTSLDNKNAQTQQISQVNQFKTANTRAVTTYNDDQGGTSSTWPGSVQMTTEMNTMSKPGATQCQQQYNNFRD